ncbi:MAG: hypothetical protein KDD73_12400 [Anaerolineales bacterium]|nr:hypothetical protein [Anaerolineales bacterium]MCB9172252.1 hypothetical protein [Ardenticatenales bacterium]
MIELAPSDRPRKVELIVLGRGLAPALIAARLAEAGRRVAWLVERPGLQTGRIQIAQGDAPLDAWLQEWQPGGGSSPAGEGWQLDLDMLLPALAAQVAAHDHCWATVGTWVRGISVIEQRVLGAIAEDSRYDAKRIVNAAEGPRYAAFARMLRHPESFRTDRRTPPLPASATPVEGAWQLSAEGDATTALTAALGLADHLVDR